MTFVVVAALLGGVVAGLIMKSIFGGIAFAVLLILFFVLWRYMKGEQNSRGEMTQLKEELKEEVKKEILPPPPVSVNNVPHQQPQQTPVYPQDTQKGI